MSAFSDRPSGDTSTPRGRIRVTNFYFVFRVSEARYGKSESSIAEYIYSATRLFDLSERSM